MYEKYFVLVTEHLFGVFAVGASSYPEEFLTNLSDVCVKDACDVMPYLLEKVGRNVLNKNNFNKITSIGTIYSH